MSRSRKRRAIARLGGHVRQGTAGQTWYRIDNFVQSPGAASIYLYGEIGMWGITAEDFVSDLQEINATQIDLHINSMGGDVFEGIAILNSLRAHRASITTYVDGLAASIASVIALAGQKVVMGQNTTMMIHEAHAIAIGEAEEMRAMADLLDKTNDNIASIYAAKAGGDIAQWREAMRVETWYSADEAVAAGLADEVDNAGADLATLDEAMAASYDLSVFHYAGRANAPAPALPAVPAAVAEPEPEVAAAGPVEPVIATEDEVDDEPVVEPTVEPDPAPDPDPVIEPDVEPEPVEIPAQPAAPDVTAEWAALMSGLLEPKPAPSTWDGLFSALLKKGPA